MKITKITYQKTYSIGPYLTDRVGFEAEPSDDWVRQDGELKWETPEIILANLRKMADEWHKSAHPHLYTVDCGPNNQTVPYAPTSIPSLVINLQEERDKEDTLASIQTAPDLDALKSFKVIASSDPTKKLYEAYVKRMKQLNDTIFR